VHLVTNLEEFKEKIKEFSSTDKVEVEMSTLTFENLSKLEISNHKQENRDSEDKFS
jgi:hypothetical protein